MPVPVNEEKAHFYLRSVKNEEGKVRHGSSPFLADDGAIYMALTDQLCRGSSIHSQMGNCELHGMR